MYWFDMSKVFALVLLLTQVLCVEGQWRPRQGRPRQGSKQLQTPKSSKSNSKAPSAPLVSAPSFDLPKNFKVEPRLDASKTPSTPGARFVKIRQGPFSIPVGKFVSEEEQWIAEPKMPCKHCYVTAIQADLEFENGSPANTDQGAMLQVSQPRIED